MKKPDAEKCIRSMATKWAATLSEKEREEPSFYDFKRWMESKGYGECFNFRSVGGADDAAEYWWAQELKQTWRY